MGDIPSYSQDKNQISKESESITINFTGKKYTHSIKKDSEIVDSHRFKELYNLYQTSSKGELSKIKISSSPINNHSTRKFQRLKLPNVTHVDPNDLADGSGTKI